MGKTEFVIEPGRHDIVMTRVFDAPRDVVFSVCTDPDLLPRWWGPEIYKTTVESADVRPGGHWHYISRDPNGYEFGFRGVYHDVVENERIVQTFEFLGTPGQVSLETLTFEEFEGKTKYTSSAVFQSVADRDSMAETDMEEGASETMDRLDELIRAYR